MDLSDKNNNNNSEVEEEEDDEEEVTVQQNEKKQVKVLSQKSFYITKSPYPKTVNWKDLKQGYQYEPISLAYKVQKKQI